MNRVIQGLHADVLSGLHLRGDLDCFGVSDEMADGGSIGQDLRCPKGCFTFLFLLHLQRPLRPVLLLCTLYICMTCASNGMKPRTVAT